MRRFWPRSLKSRYSLLLIVLVLVTQMASVLVFLTYVQRPRVSDAAQLVASQVVMLDRLLRDVPPQQQDATVRQLDARLRPPVQLTEPKAMLFSEFFRGYNLPYFFAMLKTRLPEDIGIGWQAEPERRLWFRIHIGDRPWWVTLSDIRSERVTGWGSALLLSILLSLLALGLAWLTHRHLAQPLNRLVSAARDLGRGGKPAPLPVNGPPEIADVSATFNHMLQGLSDLDEKRAMLLAGISHDLRTPLTKLQLALALEQHSYRGGHDLQRYFDDIDRILQQFIDFARGEGHEPMEKGDINQLLRTLAQDFTGLGYDFHLDLAPIAPFPWRRTSLMRLCMNLMQNAVKYGESGWEIRSWSHQGYAWVAIGDRGPGIRPEELAQINQPFQRGSGVEQSSGAGLGLAIAERIVVQHGGELHIINREQGGLEVLFTLKMRR